MKHSPGFLAITADAKSRIREVSPADAMAAVRDHPGAAMVDVREESEFAAAHLRGAVHLGKGVIERDVEKVFPNLDAELYLYCGGGFRSALACDNLQRMGYTNVHSVMEGFAGLKKAGAELES